MTKFSAPRVDCQRVPDGTLTQGDVNTRTAKAGARGVSAPEIRLWMSVTKRRSSPHTIYLHNREMRVRSIFDH